MRAGVRDPVPALARPATASAAGAAMVVIVATVMLLLCAAPASALAFPDVPPGHSYAAAIADLSARGVITGYADGTFGPDDPVMRQQFAKMICLALGLAATQADTCLFPDVAPLGGPDPLYPDHYVAKAAADSIIAGYPDGTFRPYSTITRAQVVTMVVRALNSVWPGLLGAPPADYTATWWRRLSGEHLQNARMAEINGLLIGLPLDGAASDPWAPMSRGEVAQVLHDLLWKLAPVAAPPASGRLVTVDEVLTGDTVVIAERDGLWVIHLIGVDAPGTGEPFAEDARQALELLLQGRRVSLGYDVYRSDAYGRIPAYLWFGDVLINAEILRDGLATYPPNMRPEPRQVDPLQRAARQGQEAQKGAYGSAPSVEDFFAEYPTAGDLYEIDMAFKLVFEHDPTAGQYSGGSLTPLQKRTYKVLQFMRLLSFSEPLPWTTMSLYGWFYNSVREIHFEDIEVSYFEDGVIHVATKPNSTGCLTDKFIETGQSWGLMDFFMLLVHEARHAQKDHWDGSNDHNIAELGAWGVQYYAYLYVADKSNFYVNDYAKAQLRAAADSVKNGRFTDPPQ
jgi:endonuclease YncB( thermonuclease family)